MRRLGRRGSIVALTSLAWLTALACGSTEDDLNKGTPKAAKGGNGGSAGSPSNSGGGGKAGSTVGGAGGASGENHGGVGNNGAGDTDGGGGTNPDGSAPDATTGGATSTGGSGPTGPGTCIGNDKPHETIDADITSDKTLTADKVWDLRGIVHVTNGATLTVEPCTRIEGNNTPSAAVLVISRGSKIIANGEADRPILFTGDKPAGSRAAGDWGGVVLLGMANNNDGSGVIEGLVDDDRNRYGGNTIDDHDSSGSMKYVRIEYAGYILAVDVEVNGLTFGAVGDGTTISHVMVSNSLDDCFEWFGGTVNADHLICNVDGDDSFDTDRGFRGTIEYAFGRKRANPSSDPNGFEWDNNKVNFDVPPVNSPSFKKVTLCGYGFDSGFVSYGMVLRRGTLGVIDDLVAIGFDFGVDARDDFKVSPPSVAISNSFFSGMRLGPISDPNDSSVETLNFPNVVIDEDAWFNAGSGDSTGDPGFSIDDCNPAADGAPPNDAVLDSGKGAFRDGNWMTGRWVDWADK